MTIPTIDSLDFSSLPSTADPRVHNEAFGPDGQPRDEWLSLLNQLAKLPPSEWSQRSQLARLLLHENGVTFNVFGGDEPQRPWTLDLIPATLDRAAWNWLQRAVDQRARLMQMIVRDIYGPQDLLRSRQLPPEVVYPQVRFDRNFCGLHPPRQTTLNLYAAELARAPNGDWRVMADRTDAPVGLGYVLENRVITARMLPQIIHRLHVERLALFFVQLKQALARLSPVEKERPRIVLLSPGPRFRFYFEDVYLARYLEYTLVEANDLAVRDDRVYLKTLSGLHPVDVIFTRCVESCLDPLEQGSAANDGVPGLLQAVRQGHVGLANTPGCGIVESPILMAFLPRLCEHLLGESLWLPSIPTWWCGDPDAAALFTTRWSELVVKPAFEPSGQLEYIVSEMTEEKSLRLRQQVMASPENFVVQERIERSASPCWRDDRLQFGHLAFRVYGLADETSRYSLLPGGLVRVAETPKPMELSIVAGCSSKDLWIPSESAATHQDPAANISLLPQNQEPVKLRRSEPLFPSRVADNLFWLGHSLSRADFLTRLLRATLDRLASESDEDLPELTGLVRALVDQGQIEPGFLVQEFAGALPSFEAFLIRVAVDPTEPRGLGRAVAELKRLNLTVRDWISPDLWRMTQQTAESFFDNAPDSDDLASLLNLLEQLLFGLAAVSGQIHDSMIRGPAWRFLDIGRRIESARNTASLLISVIDSQMIHQRPMLKAVLEILDCSMTYRSRYLDNIQANGTLDLAITDETNPHSLGYQAALLAEHLEEIILERQPLRSPEKRTLMRIVHAVRMLTADELEWNSLTRLRRTLQQVTTYLSQLADQLTRTYLLHAVHPKQILD